MSAKVNAPEIRFPEFEGDWEEKKLGAEVEISSASRVHKNEWRQSGVPFFRSSDVVSHYKKQDNTKVYISPELFKELTLQSGSPQQGDLLITGGGSIGIPYIVPSSDPLHFKDADLLWIKSANKIASSFLYSSFESAPFRTYLRSISHIGTIAHYTIEQAKASPFRFPADPTEQTQIGNLFEQLDALIDLQQKELQKLRQMKTSMLDKMFPKPGATVPEIRFSGFEGEWEKKTLGELGNIVGGGTPSTAKSTFWGGNINWYAPAEIGDSRFAISSVRQITELGLANSSATILPPDRTVLFTSRAGIGNMAILKNPGSTNQGFQSIVVSDSNDPYFVFSMGHLIKHQALQVASGSTFLEISGKQLARLNFTVPTLPEQIAIGNFFENLDALIDLQAKKGEKLAQVKRSLLSKMFV